MKYTGRHKKLSLRGDVRGGDQGVKVKPELKDDMKFCRVRAVLLKIKSTTYKLLYLPTELL